MTTRAALYARVSSDDTGKDGRNLAGQLEMCQEYAQGQGWQVVAKLSEDERGVSGARADAPQLMRALEMAQGGQFDTLVVREMDRFARGLGKQLTVEDQFRRAGVKVVYVLEEYKDSPEGRLSKHIRATIAEYEREKIRERTVRGKSRVVKNGGLLFGKGGPPYGYRLVKVDGRTTLEIYEDEALIVRLIFEWYTVDRLSMQAIALKLTDMQIPTPGADGKYPGIKKRAAAEWSRSSVGAILNRETYAGTWWYGKNNRGIKNPKEYLIPVTVPVIISRETWELAQGRAIQNKALATRNTRREYLLRGLCKCGECGASVNCLTSGRKPTSRLYYRCNAVQNKDYRHKCDTPYFRADMVDATVWAWIRDIVSNPEKLRQSAEAYREMQAEVLRPLQDQLAVIDSLLKKEREQLDLILDLYLERKFTKDALIDRQARTETRIKALEVDRAKLKAKIEAETLTDEQIANLEGISTLMGEGQELADMDFAKRRYVVETLHLKGELLLIDEKQHIKISCRFGQGVLFVSNTSTCIGYKPIMIYALLPLYPTEGSELAKTFFSGVEQPLPAQV